MVLAKVSQDEAGLLGSDRALGVEIVGARRSDFLGVRSEELVRIAERQIAQPEMRQETAVALHRAAARHVMRRAAREGHRVVGEGRVRDLRGAVGIAAAERLVAVLVEVALEERHAEAQRDAHGVVEILALIIERRLVHDRLGLAIAIAQRHAVGVEHFVLLVLQSGERVGRTVDRVEKGRRARLAVQAVIQRIGGLDRVVLVELVDHRGVEAPAARVGRAGLVEIDGVHHVAVAVQVAALARDAMIRRGGRADARGVSDQLGAVLLERERAARHWPGHIADWRRP